MKIDDKTLKREGFKPKSKKRNELVVDVEVAPRNYLSISIFKQGNEWCFSGIEVEGEFLRLDQIRQKNGSPIGSTNFEISMGHGKKREIRRAFLKLGYRVKKLKRFAIGKLYLDKLPLGSYRILDRKEIDLLFVG